MLKKQDWRELLQEFVDKVDKRERMIRTKIHGFQNQESAIKAKIKENSDQMIELEMNEDTGGVEKFKKENRALRNELEEIEDAISGYENQLGTSHDYYAKDLDKIRNAANKAEEERLEQVKADYALLDELEAKMDELKNQMEQTKNKLRFTRTTVEELKWKFKDIDQRVSEIPEYEKDHLVKTWLAGGDIEGIFKKKEVQSGRNVIHVDTNRGATGWVDYPTPYQS